jgi:8-oxo-dGTP pyrophosphatase MutT (NUDIX family)
MAEELARIRRALRAGEPPRHALPPGASAVLVPLLPQEQGLAVLLTRRTDHLASHAGQVSFPGGRVEPGDASPAAAALRETEEEVGLPAKAIEVLGHLDDYTTYYGRLVCAYVGAVSPGAPAPRIAAPEEVAQLLVIPVARLLAPEPYEGRALAPGASAERRDCVVHYWHLPEGTVWGITAELLGRFLARAYGWTPPRPPRLIERPEEYRDVARRGL